MAKEHFELPQQLLARTRPELLEEAKASWEKLPEDVRQQYVRPTTRRKKPELIQVIVMAQAQAKANAGKPPPVPSGKQGQVDRVWATWTQLKKLQPDHLLVKAVRSRKHLAETYTEQELGEYERELNEALASISLHPKPNGDDDMSSGSNPPPAKPTLDDVAGRLKTAEDKVAELEKQQLVLPDAFKDLPDRFNKLYERVGKAEQAIVALKPPGDGTPVNPVEVAKAKTAGREKWLIGSLIGAGMVVILAVALAIAGATGSLGGLREPSPTLQQREEPYKYDFSD